MGSGQGAGWQGCRAVAITTEDSRLQLWGRRRVHGGARVRTPAPQA